MTPAHVGVILGGTALWAQSNGTLTLEAYSRVCAKQIEIVEWCWAAGVTELTLQILAPEVSLAEKQAVVAWEQVLDHFRLGWPTFRWRLSTSSVATRRWATLQRTLGDARTTSETGRDLL